MKCFRVSAAPRESQRHIALAALIVFAASALSAQQSPASLTLAAARDRANAANPTIAAARLRRAVNVAGIGVAKERPNPDLLFETARDAPKQSIGMSIPIELGGKRGRRIDVAQATVVTGDAEVEQIIADVLNEVRRAYFQAVAAERFVTLAEDTRTLASRARDGARARFNAGDGSQADVAQADLALAAVDDGLIAARGEAAATKAELNALLGQPVGTAVAFADELAGGSVPPLEAALADAGRDNRELQVLDRRIAEQTARRNLASAQRKSDLTVGGALTLNAQPEFDFGWKANVGITLPILQSHQAGVAVEEAELARLRAEREALMARITGGVAAALARVSSARDRMTHFQTVTSPLTVDVDRYAQASYSGGQTPLLGLIVLLQQTRDIRKGGITAGLEYQLALADLERAMGTTIR
jgi:cobalt-zinc-cadmium efflux system outer membrane protein